MSNPVIVRTKSELKNALDSKAHRIIVRGDLAEKINTAYKIKKVSKIQLGLLITALATTPITGGISLAAAAPIAALTGIEISLIIAIIFLGLNIVLQIVKEYDKVTVKVKHRNTEAEIILEK